MGSRRFDVLAVGEVNVDLIMGGLQSLPSFGHEVLASAMSQHLGGCTANFACYCARLGLRTALVAQVGDDGFGDYLLAELARLGVDTTYVRRDPALPTGLTVSLSGPADRAFVTYVGSINSNVAAHIPDELLAEARLVHVGSYFLQKRLQADVPDLLCRAHRAGALTSMDTGCDPDGLWDSGVRNALGDLDLFMPNEDEAMALSAAGDPVSAQETLVALGPAVAMKLGAHGSRYLRRGEGMVEAAPYRVQVADTTCCGDAFNAGYVAAWLRGAEVTARLASGNACGAIVASAPGNAADLVSAEAIRALQQQGAARA